MARSEITCREALNQALQQEMQRDQNVYLIGEDIGSYGGPYHVTDGLLDQFGSKRVVDTPIAEEIICGIATGSALVGLRPVVEIMTINFILLAMDVIVNHAAKYRYMSGGQLSVPLTIRAPGGGGLQQAAQHSQSMETMFTNCAGLKVVMPSTPADHKGLLIESIRDDNPVIFIENLNLYNEKEMVREEPYTIPIGQADVKRPGNDVTIIAYSRMVIESLKAAEQLAGEGVDIEVVDPRTLKPLDVETLANSARKTGKVLVVEEDIGFSGFGAEIAASVTEVAFDYLDGPIKRLGAADVPLPYSKQLELDAIPNAEKIIKTVKSMI
jgi:pyruvate/2-oxoglutarate/acetoin dehydrogenase E1 component